MDDDEEEEEYLEDEEYLDDEEYLEDEEEYFLNGQWMWDDVVWWTYEEEEELGSTVREEMELYELAVILVDVMMKCV